MSLKLSNIRNFARKFDVLKSKIKKKNIETTSKFPKNLPMKNCGPYVYYEKSLYLIS